MPRRIRALSRSDPACNKAKDFLDDRVSAPTLKRSKGSILSIFQDTTKPSNDDEEHLTPISDLKRLKEGFPDFPSKMMEYLFLRYNGNCGKIFNSLVKKGWTPKGVTKKSFCNRTNKHFTLSYYYGIAPKADILELLFKKQPPGAFITYYRYSSGGDNNLYKYFLCFKAKNGKLAERCIPNLEITETIKYVLQLEKEVHTPTKIDLTCIPGF